MKKLSILFIALVATLTSWAQRDANVGVSKANTDFSKYRTFTWAEADPTAVGSAGYEIYYYEFTPERPDPRMTMRRSSGQVPYYYSYRAIIPARDTRTNDAIQAAITSELESRGYRENESSSDLIAVYQVFDQKAVLHGYAGTGLPLTPGPEPTPQDVVLEPGSLMISLIDAKTSEMVWNGYSSGLVRENAFTTDEADVKEAIHNIFEEFRHTADKTKR